MKQNLLETNAPPRWLSSIPAGLVVMLVACSFNTLAAADPLEDAESLSISTAGLLPTSPELIGAPELMGNPTVTAKANVVGPHLSEHNHSTTTDHVASVSRPASITIPKSLSRDLPSDRFWLVSTRHITSNSCRANLRDPNLRFNRLDRCGRRSPSDIGDYLSSMDPNRPRIIYIHGNRRDAPTAVSQGLWVYRELARRRPDDIAFDWVIWSWPSEAESILLADARRKAEKTDAQALYLAWLLTHHHASNQSTALIGFSFGGRVVTGAMHALSGGIVGRRKLNQPAIVGANIDVGLLAPAVDNTWISSCGHHRLATQNINRMVLLYNRRDFALKYFRFISRDAGSEALGCTGPRSVAPRHDGTRLPIRSKDCANTVGNHHSERQYYEHACYAGREMASLIKSAKVVD